MSTPPELPHPPADSLSLSQVLFALSDPARREIARNLREGPLEAAACSAVAADVPKSTKSHILKVLRESGVIRNEPNPNGRGRLLTLRRDDIEARFPGLIDPILDADLRES
ncbi:helix-turn-helix transcriptional regulator [Thioclava sp. F28-4]|uniref:ArsR/SmtB family transcription factor n=1 Tax=Thioclava sp. F28-4 TaxID=1915315 RepID=UPI0009983E88|nr:helix-turn-helix transcriptional regulator [Thioclava sp. F28-4]OOY03842.1 transcriptional regulator [Thioclava sp. F28-4]